MIYFKIPYAEALKAPRARAGTRARVQRRSDPRSRAGAHRCLNPSPRLPTRLDTCEHRPPHGFRLRLFRDAFRDQIGQVIGRA
jgi:hypothetical protein